MFHVKHSLFLYKKVEKKLYLVYNKSSPFFDYGG
jgi:hypothetical protein